MSSVNRLVIPLVLLGHAYVTEHAPLVYGYYYYWGVYDKQRHTL